MRGEPARRVLASRAFELTAIDSGFVIEPVPTHLGVRTWQQVGRPTLLVPVGSTEQHGPHLPLMTDTAVAIAVTEELARQLQGDGVDVVIAPAIAYGASGEHQAFPGTISIGHEALTLMLIEFGRSACSWAARIVFVNGHGGNLSSLAHAVPRLRAEGRDVAWVPCAPATGGSTRDTHAGRTEASLMLHLRPETVHSDRFVAGSTAPLGEILPLLREAGVIAVSPNGVLGDPRGATAVQGGELLAAMCDAAMQRVRGGKVAASGCLELGVDSGAAPPASPAG